MEKRHGIVWQGMGGYGRIWKDMGGLQSMERKRSWHFVSFCVILCHFGLEQRSAAWLGERADEQVSEFVWMNAMYGRVYETWI